jgi:hypothetical protein
VYSVVQIALATTTFASTQAESKHYLKKFFTRKHLEKFQLLDSMFGMAMNLNIVRLGLLVYMVD